MLASSRSVSARVASSPSSAAISCMRRDVVEPAAQLLDPAQVALQVGQLRGDRLGGLDVVPEVGRGGLLLEVGDLAGACRRRRRTASIDFRVVLSSSRTTEKSAATSTQGSAPPGAGRQRPAWTSGGRPPGGVRRAGRGARQPGRQLVGRHRPGDVEALRERAAQLGGHAASCSAVSTPSARLRMPQACPRPTTAATAAADWPVPAVESADQAAVDLEDAGRDGRPAGSATSSRCRSRRWRPRRRRRAGRRTGRRPAAGPRATPVSVSSRTSCSGGRPESASAAATSSTSVPVGEVRRR